MCGYLNRESNQRRTVGAPACIEGKWTKPPTIPWLSCLLPCVFHCSHSSTPVCHDRAQRQHHLPSATTMHCQLHWHALLTTHLSLISHPSGGISHEFVFWPHSSQHQTWITAMKNYWNSQCFVIYSSNYYTSRTFCQFSAIRWSPSLLAFIL